MAVGNAIFVDNEQARLSAEFLAEIDGTVMKFMATPLHMEFMTGLLEGEAHALRRINKEKG